MFIFYVFRSVFISFCLQWNHEDNFHVNCDVQLQDSCCLVQWKYDYFSDYDYSSSLDLFHVNRIKLICPFVYSTNIPITSVLFLVYIPSLFSPVKEVNL